MTRKPWEFSKSGDFSAIRRGFACILEFRTLQYQLSIPGESSQTGMLILSVADLRTIGSATAPANDVLAYTPSPDGSFLIDSFNMPGNGLDDVAFDWAFIGFAHGLTAASPTTGTTAPLAGDYNGDGKVDQQDYDLSIAISVWNAGNGVGSGR